VERFGIELGIRAREKAVVEGANIARSHHLDYYFVPETKPDRMGVNAFDALYSIAKPNNSLVIGTAIVNVFGRDKKEILGEAEVLYDKTCKNFVLGIGSSAPPVVSGMYNKKFEKPVQRMSEYTQYIRTHSDIPVFWGAVGDGMIKRAAEIANGVIFFLKTPADSKRAVESVNSVLVENGKDIDRFEVASIRPTYIVEDEKEGMSRASMTIASYIFSNKFYSRAFTDEELKRNSEEIKKEFARGGLLSASEKVSKKMIEELATYGSEEKCLEELVRYSKDTGVKTVIAGFDYPESQYNQELFRKIENLTESLRCCR
jgi:alkanesulfonate monooxygenase SsuD/methylene tetrahydromethanopterin reductase-like flavin-dependent oxidoreductase (luciferase family)